MRYYLGVDWADQTHAVWVVDEHQDLQALQPSSETAQELTDYRRHVRQQTRLVNQLRATL